MPLTGKVKKIPKSRQDIEWKIEHFSDLDKTGRCYSSPDFSYDGQSWFLGIDPNGDSYNDSLGYINLYFYRISSGPPINVKFSLSLKDVKGMKNLERHCSGIFQQWNHRQFLRFFPTSELEERKAALLPSDVLTVVCTIQNATPTSNITTAECTYCKETFNSEDITMHEKKCTDRPIKCPECSDVILLLNWYEHECQRSRVGGGNNKVQSSVLPQNNRILQDFKRLLQMQEDCDVIIKVKEKEFSAHRAILKVRSPVFASTFRSNMKEKLTGIINIEDCEPSAFSEFLCFLYCGDVENLSQENMFDLYVLSDKYDVPYLKEKSMEFIKANLSIDTFCETITLAVRHSESELIKHATDFFIKNAQEIIKTVKWQTFLAENPTQSNELFIKLLASNKCLNA